MVPRTILSRSGPISVNTVRPVITIQPRTTVNNAGPMKNVINNAYSIARRPFNKITAANNSNFTKKVNTVKGTRVNTARPKAVLSAVKGNKGNAVKASAYWVWRPKHKILDHVSRNNGTSMSFKRFDYIDAQGRSKSDKGVNDSGCSRHMTGNKFYLTDYEEIDGGFVAFGGNSKGGKITGKGKIRTGKLDFEDVYFVKELKFNLFSVLQMCDKKNSILFTDTECVVLSPDFKLTDKSHVLLKVPRKDNMYNVDLKNVVPKLALSFMRPFGCPVTILNTIDHLGKVDRKADEGFFIGYSTNSKAFRVFNNRTRIVEENLHVQFSENTPNIAGSGPNWLFDINALTNSMNYNLVVAGNQSNGSAGTKACDNEGKARVETVPGKDYILLPLWTQDPTFSFSPKDSPDAGFKPLGEEEKKDAEDPGNEGGNPSKEGERINQEKDASVNSTNNINTASDGNNTNNVNVVSSTVNAVGIEVNDVDPKTSIELLNDPNMPELEDIVYSDDDEDVGAEADLNNLDAFMLVSPIPTTKIHKDHPVEQIIKDIHSAPQTRRMTKILTEHAMFCSVQQRTNHKDFQNCLLACFLLQEEPKKVVQALKDPGWIEAMQEDLLQFKLQEVWTLMDVKSAFLYGKIEEEVYVCQPLGFEEPYFPERVYKVRKAVYRLHQAPRAWYETLSTYLLDNGFQRGKRGKIDNGFIRRDKGDILLVQMSSMGELTFFLGLQVKQKEDGILISQDKYVTEILKKFGFSDAKTARIPMETHKPFLKDADGEDVDKHLYRSMIGSLMYLTSSRSDIMFAVYACARFQVNPKISHLHAVKRIFRYLKGASLDKKSTTGGCQFLRCRLISWQCKKQTMVTNSTTEAEYIAASNCFKNPVFHLKTKHTEIRHHFIRDSNEKKLIQMIKIYRDQNVTDLLTKAFDVSRFQYLIAKNADFAKIVDFLNANPIRYALTVSPTIYVSCIEQLWSTAKTKTVNNETQIHAKVEGKTIVISESSVRRDLQFNDEDKVNSVYDTPSHNKKIFANMRRQGKDFSGTVTPLFSSMLAQQANMGEGSGQPTNPQHTSISVQPSNEEPITVPSSSQPKKTHRPRKAKRATEISQSSRPIPLVADKTVTKEREDIMERAITTASSLEAEQDSGSGLRCQDTILGDAEAETRSGEDILKLKELMDLYTKLSDRVLDLETTNIAQAKEIASLKKRVKKMERKRKSKNQRMNLFKIGTSSRRSLFEEDASKQGRNLKQGKQSSIFEDTDFDEEFDANMDEAIEQVYDANKDTVEEGEVQVPTANMEVNTASVPVTTAGVSVSTAEPITTASVNITTAEPITPLITTAIFEDEVLTNTQTLIKMRSEKSKVRGVVMQEPSSTATRPTVPPQQHDPKDKGKGKMVEQEKPLKKKDQIKFDEEIAQRLQAHMQAELEEEERLAREREENANIDQWDNAQAMMDVDYELAARIHAQEAEEKRRKPLTKAQKRNQMCTYLKNMAGFTHNQLKNKIFDEVQKAFDKTISWIDSFVPVDSEVVKGSKDRAVAVWFREAEESFLHNVTENKETAKVGATGVAVVPKTPLQFGVAERLSQTFRAESTGLRAEAPKMLWVDSVSTAYLIYRIPYVPIRLGIPEEE
ncbi:putative ribonuclease H-like domain-containing protein [Tanacetum coccineum]